MRLRDNLENADTLSYDLKNLVFNRVTNIEKAHYDSVDVYDLTMEDTSRPNYLTEIGFAHNGGNKRKGSFAMYLEPWHADVEVMLNIRKNHGKEEDRARDLFPALWIPDLFMQRVKEDKDWTLMCPSECPGLSDVYGKNFETLYTSYEKEGRGKKVVKATDLYRKILTSQIETGTPYMLYKDAANAKSNQQNLGTIKSSNLCAEIIEYTSPEEQAVCNLASLSLPYCIEDGVFNFKKLEENAYQVTKNLNAVIDVNFYPTPETKISNMKHRPIGIGVQGLADVFAMLKLPFESAKAVALNDDIFETIYYGALLASKDLAIEQGAYSTFKGSPASKGILQFDMWDKTEEVYSKNRYDWKGLKAEIIKHGIRNSLLLAPMPTASTAQILGNNECFEPFTTNMYTRRVLSGEFLVINEHMVKDLLDIGMWNEEMKGKIMAENGSIMNIPEIPVEIRELYKTVWEISQKTVINMAADRGKYICQSQSMNIFMKGPTENKLAAMHMYGWEKGLKTGMYYLRTTAAVDAIKFTVDKQIKVEDMAKQCSIDNPEDCEMCGS